MRISDCFGMRPPFFWPPERQHSFAAAYFQDVPLPSGYFHPATVPEPACFDFSILHRKRINPYSSKTWHNSAEKTVENRS